MSEANTLPHAVPDAKQKGVCWSITINNPTPDDFQQWESLKAAHWVREVSGQLEKGEKEETPHIQGMLKTESVRFSQVKKALPRAHIEKARSQIALAKYVHKDETRVGTLPTMKVATQKEVQVYCLSFGLQMCYDWEKERLQEEPDPLTTDEIEMLGRYKIRISQNWEAILDKAVETLIYQGFYGVEFVVSNPQVRLAFKKYLPAILYRTYNETRR